MKDAVDTQAYLSLGDHGGALLVQRERLNASVVEGFWICRENDRSELRLQFVKTLLAHQRPGIDDG